MHLQYKTRKWIYRVMRDYELEERHIRLLVLAGEAWDRGQEAREKIATEGLTIRDRFAQLRPHPAVAIERDSRIAFARLVREVGLDTEDAEPSRPPRIGRK